MTDDELKTIWKASDTRMRLNTFHTINFKKMNAQIKKFEDRINRRNTREIVTAIIGILVFVAIAIIITEPLKKIGAILLIFYAIGVIYYIRKPKEKEPKFDIVSSIREQLLGYQEYVMEERKSLKDVLYWYILPMFPGLTLFVLDWTWQAKLIYFIGILFISISIYRRNQKAVITNMNPLLDDIDKALKSLEEKM